ncbi:hypothetical protein BGX24_000929 [Mortierella sp. AD032]|nr:hypothetical protein BGX24_000929 [Mortierella sp. AD032]
MAPILRAFPLLTVLITLIVTTQNAGAAPTPPAAAVAGNPFEKRLILPNAPLASDINGAHILLKNDLDSVASKRAFLLLSQARDYYAGMSACASMGDGGYIYIAGTAGANDLVDLLKTNVVAPTEVTAYSQFWVFNAIPGIYSNCLALNKNTGLTDWIPCSTTLPTVCYNSALRRTLVVQDSIRQVKLNVPGVGQLQGWRDQSAFRFLGVPFAEAPVGKLRFAAPIPKAPFKTTLDATYYKDVCPQSAPSDGVGASLLSGLLNGAQESEDCLNLNVYTPSLKGQKLLPVMFYIHGGGYTGFSGSVVLFDGGNLASRGGVVTVTTNYRLGMLGFTENASAFPRSEVSGNQGIRDQILALEWTKKNIAAFGGDPDRITIFGESAGAASLRALLSAPSAFGLYTNVIGQSDPINIPFKSRQDSAAIQSMFFLSMGCASNDLGCARSKSVGDLMNAQVKANAMMVTEQNWTTTFLVDRPTVDHDLIPGDFFELVKTGKHNTKANIMWGSTKDEAGRFVATYYPTKEVITATNYGSVFAKASSLQRVNLIINNASSLFKPNMDSDDPASDLFNDFYTKYYFYCPLKYFSKEITKAGGKVFQFRFNYGRGIPVADAFGYCRTNTGRVCHAQDLSPVFGTGAMLPLTSQVNDDARFARQIIDRWTTFAKTGNPNPTSALVGVENSNPDVAGINWPAYDGSSNPMLELGVMSKVSSNADQAACAFMDYVLQYDFMFRNTTFVP